MGPHRPKGSVVIDVLLDLNQQTITIKDNAGDLKRGFYLCCRAGAERN